jgi:hypothetical protein
MVALSSLGDPRKHIVVGLFDNPMKSSPTMIGSLGIGCHTRDPGHETPIQDHITLPHLEPEERPQWMTKTADKVFLSKASLSNVTSLKIQKRDARCIGVYILHDSDSAAETLGQWDPSRPQDTIHLWDSVDGSTLDAVTFILSPHSMPQEVQVADVVAGKKETNDNVFVWDDPTRVSLASFLLDSDIFGLGTYSC